MAVQFQKTIPILRIFNVDTTVPLVARATSAPPASREEIGRLLEIASRYGVEIKMPDH